MVNQPETNPPERDESAEPCEGEIEFEQAIAEYEAYKKAHWKSNRRRRGSYFPGEAEKAFFAFIDSNPSEADYTVNFLTLRDAYFEEKVNSARKTIGWMFEERAVLSKHDPDFGFDTTFRDVSTGKSVVIPTPNAGEHRYVLDFSNVATPEDCISALWALYGEAEQLVLGQGGPTTITDDRSNEWIERGLPQPSRWQAEGLRTIIILKKHGLADDVPHYLAHRLVLDARRAAGQSTFVWLSGANHTEICNLFNVAHGYNRPFRGFQYLDDAAVRVAHFEGVGVEDLVTRREMHVVISNSGIAKGNPSVGLAIDAEEHLFIEATSLTVRLILALCDHASIIDKLAPHHGMPRAQFHLKPGCGLSIFTSGSGADVWRAAVVDWARGRADNSSKRNSRNAK